jgi:hypothetical protein
MGDGGGGECLCHLSARISFPLRACPHPPTPALPLAEYPKASQGCSGLLVSVIYSRWPRSGEPLAALGKIRCSHIFFPSHTG